MKVYHDVTPPGPGSEDFLLGQTYTDDDGKWKLTSPYQPDKVYAKVKGNKSCRKDTSKTEPVD